MANTSPNPAYNFLPIFIATNLRFPSNSPHAGYPCNASVASVKIKLDDLRRLFRRREELPFLHGVLARLHQQGMAADYPRAAYVPIRRNDHFDLDFAGNAHPAGQLRVRRRSLYFHLTLAIVRVRLLRACA